MTTNAQIAPTPPSERIEVMDVLRGFALLGILAVNMGIFSFPFIAQITGTPRGTTPLDQAAEFAVAWLATGKFYPLFSFLFGLGMSLQIAHIEARGDKAGKFMVRRLLVLMLFGLIHALLIWNGDILFLYALTGLVALLFRRLEPRTLLIWAGLLFAIPILIGLAGVFSSVLVSGPAVGGDASFNVNAMLADLERQSLEVYANGTWGQIFVWRAVEWLITLTFFLFGSGLQILAIFLVGMYFGKRGIFQNQEAHLPLFRKGLLIGLVVGLPANFAIALLQQAGGDVMSPLTSLWSTLVLVFGPVLTFGYISAFVLLTQRDTWRRRLTPLEAAGRMALSNYIAQSIIATLIFYSYGLGLFGQVGAFAGLVLTFAIWLIQLPISVLWLGKFRFGPLEWLWRSLTYGRMQPMGKPSAAFTQNAQF
jgi:uncharacterized protein